ncbi:RecT family recombinase [Bacillus sp. 3255]|uniref:RecT family recombinase n=1 Tax=Bacillus sp. 3255 TaxID=2817904 RepID=UPI00285ABA1A|nr:RecT family recombinase [Bacillus sp. 3255]MDR6883063.1 recombination protein RecT [Bacillus sp. 3255]
MSTQVQVIGDFTQAELDTIKNTIAKGTTDAQFNLFARTAAAAGLNPFLNQIHCIVYQSEKYGPQMSIQISVEGIVALGKRHPQYKGFIASEVKENDDFEIDMVTGEPKHRIISMTRGKTVGAYCVAYREGAPNIAVIITNDQVDHLTKGRNKDMWTSYFDDMIVKHAIKRAFKRQYGVEISEDEYATQNNLDLSQSQETPQRKDITSEATHTNTPPATVIEEPKVDPVKQAMNAINDRFNQLGITDKAARNQYLKDNKITFKDPKVPTLAELQGAVLMLDQKIADNEEPLNLEE